MSSQKWPHANATTRTQFSEFRVHFSISVRDVGTRVREYNCITVISWLRLEDFSYSWLWKLRVCKQNPTAGEIRRMWITTAVAVCLTDQKKALQWERLLICRNQMPISSGNRLCKWTCCVYSTDGELINLGNPKKIKVIFLTTKILILNYIVTLLLIFLHK